MFYCAADSHRASIPALLMGRLSISNTEIDKRASRKYTLNALEGIHPRCVRLSCFSRHSNHNNTHTSVYDAVVMASHWESSFAVRL